MLVEESGIDPEIAAERGYWTARNQAELTDHPKYQQRVPALMIPTYSPDGETTRSRLRPDAPRVRRGKTIKYEHPHGEGMTLDVHPRNLSRIQDADEDLWITEGEKKGDSLTSRGLCAIALFGVDCWGKGGELLPCWEHVALSGRAVYVAYDSDVMVKPEVLNALERLTGALEARGATVKVVYLPDAEDGGKQGVDDYLAAGGTVEALYGMARTFEASDATGERLTRNQGLREAIDRLWTKWEEMPAKSGAAAGRRSVARDYIRQAEKKGVVQTDGIRVVEDQRSIAERCQISQPTVARALAFFEEAGFLYRDNCGKRPERGGAVVLKTPRAVVNQNEGRRGLEEGSPTTENKGTFSSTGLSHHYDSLLRGGREADSYAGSDRGDSQTRGVRAQVQELRNSRVIISWKLDEFGLRVCEVDPLVRHGKKRQHMIEYIVESGGLTTVTELMGIFASEKTRRRDFIARTLGPLVDDPQIIEVDGEEVRLTADWRDALDNARTLVQEPEDSDRQRIRHELQRAAFHGRKDHPANYSPTYADMDAAREERELRRRDQEQSRSMLAAAMREYLLQSPHDAKQPANWITTTMWAYGWIEGNPDPTESKSALAELGGAESVIAEIRGAG